jgi:FdhD protein
MSGRLKTLHIDKINRDRRYGADDELAVEEPLEVAIDGTPYMITMRLPGEDADLVRGWCLTEGLVQDVSGIKDIRPCPDEDNRILVDLAAPRMKERDQEAQQLHISRSSCGVCGKSSLDGLDIPLDPVPRSLCLAPERLFELKKAFEAKMELFPRTGCIHSAALFGSEGELLAFAEDIGRHNALDKAIGKVLLQGGKGLARLAVLSSRLSYELVQKGGVLGLEIMAGVSAATSLAASLADDLQMTLVGFLRETRMNIYTHPSRIS